MPEVLPQGDGPSKKELFREKREQVSGPLAAKRGDLADALAKKAEENDPEFEKFSDALMVLDFWKFDSDQIRSLYEAEKDPAVLIHVLGSVKAAFMDNNGSGSDFAWIIDGKGSYSLRKIVPGLVTIKNLGLLYEGGISEFLISGFFDEKAFTDFVVFMRAHDFKENLFHSYILAQELGVSAKIFLAKFQELQNFAGELDDPLGVLREFEGDVDSFIYAYNRVKGELKDYNLNKAELIFILSKATISGEDYLGDLIKTVEYYLYLKPEGISIEEAFSYYSNYEYMPRIKKVSRENVKAFYAFKKYNFVYFSAGMLIESGFEASELEPYILRALEKGMNNLGEILAWYKLKVTVNVAVHYREMTERAGLKSRADLLYDDDVKEADFLGILEIAEKYKIDEVDALYIVKALHKKGAKNFKAAKREFFKFVEKSNLIPEKAIIAWFLCDDVSQAKNLFQLYEETTLFRGTMSSVLPHLFSIFKKGFLLGNIIDASKVASNYEELEELLVLEAKYRLRDIMRVDVELDGAKWSVILAIKIVLYGRNEEIVMRFMRHILIHTSMISPSNVYTFFSDPAIEHCFEVYNKVLSTNVIFEEKYCWMVGRNLYLKGISLAEVKEMSGENILLELERIQGLRKTYAEMHLFKDRRVVLVSHAEKWKQDKLRPVPEHLLGKKRFGTKELRDSIKTSIGETDLKNPLMVIGAEGDEPGVEELISLKANTLRAVMETPPPFTFVFDGHGGPDGLYLSDGQIGGKGVPEGAYIHCFISSEELAGAIAARRKKFPKEVSQLSHDIYIFESCFNHTFMRRVLAINKNKGGVQPIVIGSAEYGQYGFSNFNERQNGIYAVLGAGNKYDRILDIMDTERFFTTSDYSLYVPDEDDVPQQIVEIEDKRDEAEREREA